MKKSTCLESKQKRDRTMNKDLLKYNVSDLALSIGEACRAIELAVKSQNHGNYQNH